MSEPVVVNMFVDLQSNIRLVDLVGDGDHRLVVADMARKLIVYKVYIPTCTLAHYVKTRDHSHGGTRS